MNIGQRFAFAETEAEIKCGCGNSCAAKLISYNFVGTPRKFTIAKLSIRKLGSSSVLTMNAVMLCDDKFTQCFQKSYTLIHIHHASTYKELKTNTVYTYY